MPTKHDIVRLHHIRDAAQKASNLITGKSRHKFDDDEIAQLAAVKLIEIIGEAASQLSPEFREQTPQIPWRQITAMRNRLVHADFEMDLDILRQTLTSDLPPLIAQIETLLQSPATE